MSSGVEQPTLFELPPRTVPAAAANAEHEALGLTRVHAREAGGDVQGQIEVEVQAPAMEDEEGRRVRRQYPRGRAATAVPSSS